MQILRIANISTFASMETLPEEMGVSLDKFLMSYRRIAIGHEMYLNGNYKT
jgi:hypothetical protein